MIALNELLDNLDLYKTKYQEKGLHFNLDVFVKLENERKALQMKTEKMRALCNKLCSEVPNFKKNGKDTEELVKQITTLDNQIKSYNKTLQSYERKINSKLRKLHNLPEFNNKRHEQMPIVQNPSTRADLIKFINENYKPEKFNKNILSLSKARKNMVFDERELPLVVECSDGFTFCGTLEQTNELRKLFMDYFEKNSFSLIKVSSRKILKSNSACFFVHLNKRESVYFETIKEFHSREHKIKYHDTKLDMTKFVNQLNVLLKW